MLSRKQSTVTMPSRFTKAGRLNKSPKEQTMSIEAIRERRARLESMLTSNNFRLPPLKNNSTPKVEQPSRPSSRTPLPDIGSRPGSQERANARSPKKEKREKQEKQENEKETTKRAETQERHEQQQEEMLERMRKQMQELMQSQMQELMQKQMREMQKLLEQQVEHKINYNKKMDEVRTNSRGGEKGKESGDRSGKKESEEAKKEKDGKSDAKGEDKKEGSGKTNRLLKKRKSEDEQRKELEEKMQQEFKQRNRVLHSGKMRGSPLLSEDAFLPGEEAPWGDEPLGVLFPYAEEDYFMQQDPSSFQPEDDQTEHPVQEPEDDQENKEDEQTEEKTDDQTGEETNGNNESQDETGDNENKDPNSSTDKHKDEDEESDEEDISGEGDEIVEGLKSEDKKRQLSSAERARHLLSSPRPPVNQLIQAGILPPLVQCMTRQDVPELQLEAAWAVTNIASGKSKHTNAVVDAGAIRVLIDLLSSKNAGVREQAVWALGNIVGDGPECRDRAIQEGIIKPLIDLLGVNAPVSIARQVCWVITNLFRFKNPTISSQQREMCALAIKKLVKHYDTKVQADSLWAAAYFSDMGSDTITELVDCGIVKDMVQRLYSDDEKVVTAALRATGSVAAGNHHQTDAVVAAGALTVYRDLLRHSNLGIARETAWILSNITAGTPHQIQMVIDVQVVPALMAAVEKRDEELQKESSWALCNMVSGGTDEQVAVLVSLGIVTSLCHLLKSKDEAIVMLGLEAINNVFLKSTRDDAISRIVEGVGGLNTLRNLQSHQDQKISKMASSLVTRFFDNQGRSNIYGY